MSTTPIPSLVLSAALDAEWQRIGLLAQIASQSRHGQAVQSELLQQLDALQHQVAAARQNGGMWQALSVSQLNPLECDVLACAVAAEAEPRLGWAFQGLQPGAPQPYPTRALLQELLALDAGEAHQLYAALEASSPLRRQALLTLEDNDAYQPIRPSPTVIARLYGRPEVPGTPPGARRVDRTATWDDLVLPADRMAMLREFLCWIIHRDTVVGRWGGASLGGPVALFSGPSGTGKTFAASVLISVLGEDWQLFRVDLGQLVSKYIGETEKNVNRLFDCADGRPVVLQFDEADSLFSKRGNITEARDRYANMEVSHMLARIEEHHGPCILTTNLREQLDPAFARRFQIVVDFPWPDAAARSRLWAKLLPPRAPYAAEVDPDFLGAAVNLSGGGIQNAALHAAYLAADAAVPIDLSHIALGAWRELSKEGREVASDELGALAGHLPENPL